MAPTTSDVWGIDGVGTDEAGGPFVAGVTPLAIHPATRSTTDPIVGDR
jgi:hypothetical protein